MALGGLAGTNCNCQWGLTGIFLGTVVILAAGVFTAIPAFFGELDFPWYIALCWFWFGLGVALLMIGIVLEVKGCRRVKAREIMYVEEDGSGEGVAPTPYIMIK
ncbi:unnamed protein product [Polarella glacialis]|uniref:Transmembrane protein n=1 Tax=Polarella glacialis TaxID=89957 RepID=A0A813HI53_POLGL|nr:unnamed protein product [Polarella glacialis]CAE8598493.1 unnamed protein product [Polarella glacialis]CAE8637167.1 unnamed protein product [Polarella glacialis]CAE8637168.1 unnamed protein product [Polarella glacialis]CAE8649685.1 unnamed protein product [Polarella glacialis]